jgi:hypothetical protein
MSTITVQIRKLDEVVEFVVESLPAASIQYLLQYGATQSINDCHASVIRKNFETDTAFADAVMEKVNERVNQIRTGEVPGTRGTANPAMAKARALVAKMADDPKLAAQVEALLAA